LNNAFVNNLAYDYPEDARGYNFGLTAALMNPRYAVRFGAFAMPTSPGSTGVQYADDAHSEQLEVDFNPVVFKSYKTPAVVRLSVFRNQGFMGTNSDALAGSTPPTLSSVRVPGLVRYGFGVNCEQALSDDGTTGLFARLGVADGSIESDAYAEADSALSFGIQIGGSHWKRKDDVAGLALGFSGVSDVHQRYLNTGGLGLTLGDSALRYGAESVLEAYYLRQLTKSLSVTLDFQCVSNPGYNRDRGPAPILSLRVRYAF
jgi:carbohydrate-selective porin OprB